MSTDCPDAAVYVHANGLEHGVADSDDMAKHALETHVFTVLVGVITVLCIILNGIGVYAFMRMPRTPSNLVYLHLCFTDLIVGIFVTPYSIIILSENLKSKHRVYCIIQGIMFEVSYTTTLFILTYISLDRLLALYLPLKYKEWMSKRTLFWINIGTWVVPVLRPMIRYIMAMFKVDCEEYTYHNDDYFMVCYNTDYIGFVKGDKNFTVMIDQCIIVVLCQFATFFSSILVIFRLSHRLHIKRSKEVMGNRRESTLKHPPMPGIPKNGLKATNIRSNSVIDKKRIHHFHATPELTTDDGSTVQSSRNVRSIEDDTNTVDFEDSMSYDDTQQVTKVVKKKRKREAERHAITTMIIVIMFFMITYTPSFLCFIIPGIYKKAKSSGYLWIFLMVDYCTFINSTFLPMVHFSRSHGFKRQMRQLHSKSVEWLRYLGVIKRNPSDRFSKSRGISATFQSSLRNNCGAATAIITLNETVNNTNGSPVAPPWNGSAKNNGVSKNSNSDNSDNSDTRNSSNSDNKYICADDKADNIDMISTNVDNTINNANGGVAQ